MTAANELDSSSLWKKLKDLFKKIDTFVKEHQELAVGGLTAVVGLVAVAVTIETANIQANATIGAAKIQEDVSRDQSTAALVAERKTILNEYIGQMKELLDNEGAIKARKEAIEAKSFATLRILDDQGKGYLIRFLDEHDLIVNQPQISLSGADLTKINLQDAWLPDITLNGAYLTNGILRNTNLKRADLIKADLKGVDLTDADLTKANLTGANLTGANLTGANLTGANLTGESLSGAKLCNTILADGSNSGCP